MWEIFKKYKNKNIDTFYFKENATRDCDSIIIDFNRYKNTKVQIDKDQKLFYFEENKNEHIWKITSEITENEEFNLKQFIVEDEFRTLKKIIIFNKVKMIVKNEKLLDGIKHIYGKPGSLYEEHSEFLGKIG